MPANNIQYEKRSGRPFLWRIIGQATKCLVITITGMRMASSVKADPPSWQELSAHLFTNAVIVWQAPTNLLPKKLWVYQRELPRLFSPTVISNAMVLGSLQHKGIPRPNTNDFYIAEDKPPGNCCGIPTIFGIQPGDAFLYYGAPKEDDGLGSQLPSDETIIMLALHAAAKFGLDPTKLVQKSLYTRFADAGADGKTTGKIRGRGIFLSRQLDGIIFFSADNEGDGAEGLSLEMGSYGQIRSFFLRWSDLHRYENHTSASPADVIACIKAHVTMVLPHDGEEDYFPRLKRLAAVKKLTITKLTPYYGEGIFGESPTNDAPAKFAVPFAELEAVADFGKSNCPVQLISPILSSEVHRLLGR